MIPYIICKNITDDVNIIISQDDIIDSYLTLCMIDLNKFTSSVKTSIPRTLYNEIENVKVTINNDKPSNSVDARGINPLLLKLDCESPPVPVIYEKWCWFDSAFVNVGDDTYAISIIDQAKAAGYNGFVVASARWYNYLVWTPNSKTMMTNVREYCKTVGMKFIFTIHRTYLDYYYKDPALWHPNVSTNIIDPNADPLFEGIPANDMRFIVQMDGTITPDPLDLGNGKMIANPGDPTPRFNLLNSDFITDAFGNWWAGQGSAASLNYGWDFSPNYGNLYDGGGYTGRSRPITATKDMTVMHDGTYSIKIETPAIGTWEDLHAYTQGDFLRKGDYVYYVKTTGISGATEPIWDHTKTWGHIPDTLIIDGTVEWYAGNAGSCITPSLNQTIWEGTGSPPTHGGYACRPVVPYTYVHISCWLKFENYIGNNLRWSLIGRITKDGTQVTNQSQGGYACSDITSTSALAVPHTVPYTADWAKYDIAFNTLDCTEISFSLFFENTTSGKVWIADMIVEPGGTTNVLRRADTPFTMTSEDGLTTYAEDIDYENAIDTHLRDLTPGGYPGGYAGPTVWRSNFIPVINKVGTALNTGDIVLCSYCHVGFYDGSVQPCLCNPIYLSRIKECIQGVRDLLDPDVYYMDWEEMVLIGWDYVCQSYGAGESLAFNVSSIYNMIMELDPTKEVCIWSDQFDPYHFADQHYHSWMNEGHLTDSWEGLDPNMIIINWNHNPVLIDENDNIDPNGIATYKRSLQFFNSRGHKQILAGFYDNWNPTKEATWVSYAQNYGYDGAMYTTWYSVRDYSYLQLYINVVNANEIETFE
jgi:hypothetical protein